MPSLPMVAGWRVWKALTPDKVTQADRSKMPGRETDMLQACFPIMLNSDVCLFRRPALPAESDRSRCPARPPEIGLEAL